MKAGKLNTLLQIEELTGVPDEVNQLVEAWTLFKEVWGDIRGANGLGVIKESEGVGKAISRYSIRIRYKPNAGINVGMRVNHHGEIFSIVQIQHDFAGRDWTDLVCELGGNDG